MVGNVLSDKLQRATQWQLGVAVVKFPEWSWIQADYTIFWNGSVGLRAKQLSVDGEVIGIVLSMAEEYLVDLYDVPEPRRTAIAVIMLDDLLHKAVATHPGARFAEWYPDIYRGEDGRLWPVAEGFYDQKAT